MKAKLGLPLTHWLHLLRTSGTPYSGTVPTHTAPTLGQGEGRKGQYLIGVEGLEAGLGRAVEGAGDIESVV